MGWMAYTVAIDSIDGTLARAVGVKQVLPFFDGTRLDDIVDYFTYVIVPMLFVLRFDLLPPALAVPVALCPVLASAYGFCRKIGRASCRGVLCNNVVDVCSSTNTTT